MLEQRVAVEERPVPFAYRRITVGAAPRLDRRDLAMDRLLVLRRLDGHVPHELGVEREDADLVPLVEEVDDQVGGFLRDLELVDLVVVLHAHRHGAGPVDHEHHREARDLDLLLHLHGDRQGFFDRGAVEAAEAEALFSADHDQAATLVPDVVADEGHLLARHLERGQVGEDHAVVLLERGHRGGQALGADQPHVDVLGAEGVGQVLGLRLLLVDQEHLRLAAHHGDPDGAVVLLDDVALDLDQRLVDVDPGILERLAVRQDVLPRVEPHHLRAEELAVPVEGQPPARLLDRGDDGLRVERLAELDLVRQEELLDDDLLGERQADRRVVDRDAGVLGRLGGHHGLSRVLAAVRQDHDPVGLAARKRGLGKLDRPREIRHPPDRAAAAGGRRSASAGAARPAAGPRRR